MQADAALTKLEKYSEEDGYFKTKSAIHMNILFRLLRVRFLEEIDIENKALVKRLENTFLKHYDAIQNQDGFHTRKAVALARKGAFFKDQSLIDQGYQTLADLNEDKWINSLEQELYNYDGEEEYAEELREENKKIGGNIEKARLASGLSKRKLAESLRMTVADITLVEAGRKRLSYNEIRKAADALSVTSEYFIMGDGGFDDGYFVKKLSSNAANKRKALIEELNGQMKMLSNEEMRFTADFMRFLIER